MSEKSTLLDKSHLNHTTYALDNGIKKNRINKRNPFDRDETGKPNRRVQRNTNKPINTSRLGCIAVPCLLISLEENEKRK